MAKALKRLIEGVGWAAGTVTFAVATLIAVLMAWLLLGLPAACDLPPTDPSCSNSYFIKLVYWSTWIGLTALGIASAVRFRRQAAFWRALAVWFVALVSVLVTGVMFAPSWALYTLVAVFFAPFIAAALALAHQSAVSIRR